MQRGRRWRWEWGVGWNCKWICDVLSRWLRIRHVYAHQIAAVVAAAVVARAHAMLQGQADSSWMWQTHALLLMSMSLAGPKLQVARCTLQVALGLNARPARHSPIKRRRCGGKRRRAAAHQNFLIFAPRQRALPLATSCNDVQFVF